MITNRPGTTVEDLRAAEAVLSRAWGEDAPFVASHPGDLEWWYATTAPDELAAHLRLWELDDVAVAWSWVRHDRVHWEVGPIEPTSDHPIVDAILRAAIAETTGVLLAWAPEDDPSTLAALARVGFRPEANRLSQFQRRVDDDSPIPDDRPPRGYRIRHVRGPQEVAARMEVHQSAFPDSALTVAEYERLTTLPHYAFEADLVVEAPDGSLAAFAMAWWDPVARVGEFEPVGTRPEHQRRGLGRALLSHGLRRFRTLGAGIVQVYSHADNAASEGLYEAVGFRRRRYRRRFERREGRDVRSIV